MPPGEDALAGLKGVKAFRGTIAHAASAGISAGTLLDKLRAFTQQAGGRWTQATERAVLSRYSVDVEAARKGLSLSRVRPDIAITDRWVAFGNLQRDAASFGADPRFRVRYHLTGERAGVEFERWKTNYYLTDIRGAMTLGELSEDLSATALDTETESLADSDITIRDIEIAAI